MYLLTLVPVLTDVLETGGWPRSPRAWFTELVVGLLIFLLVCQVVRHQRSLADLARIDTLTGLGNRRFFDEAVRDECARAARSNRTLTLVIFDLDHFKQVNDTDGHAAGDAVLRQFADALQHAVRERIDRGFRIGGDEFALLLPETSAAQADIVIARIRDHCAISDSRWRQGPLGVSAGIIVWQALESVDEFVRRADAAMFQAKQVGRRTS